MTTFLIFLFPFSGAREAERRDASWRVDRGRTGRHGHSRRRGKQRWRNLKGWRGEWYPGKAEPRWHVRNSGRTQAHGTQLVAQRPLRDRWGQVYDARLTLFTCYRCVVFSLPVLRQKFCSSRFLVWCIESEQTCALMQLMKSKMVKCAVRWKFDVMLWCSVSTCWITVGTIAWKCKKLLWKLCGFLLWFNQPIQVIHPSVN